MALSTWRNDFDNFFNTLDSEFMGLVPMGRRHGHGRPQGMSLDLRETDGEYIVTADVPGVEKSDIDVSVEKGVLTISAERSEARKGEKDRYHFSERTYGKVSRSIRLPDNINEDGLEANYSNGVLTLSVPKDHKAQRRQINIK